MSAVTIQILFAVLGALLAIIGVYTVFREVLLSAIASKEVTVAVVLREAVDEVTLDLLLDEANRHPRRRRGQRVALIVPEGLSESLLALPGYAELIQRYRAEVFFAEPSAE